MAGAGGAVLFSNILASPSSRPLSECQSSSELFEGTLLVQVAMAPRDRAFWGAGRQEIGECVREPDRMC